MGDVAYWDGTKVKTIPVEGYYPTLGPAIGVVVVPEGFAPDGKTRIVSLYYVNEDGSKSNTPTTMKWSLNTNITPNRQESKLPTTDNAGSTTIGMDIIGFLPSDNFTGTQSYVDPLSKYSANYDNIKIISPYLGYKLNPDFYAEPNDYNVFKKFDGKQYTKNLVDLGSDYVSANACWNYKDGYSNIQWYLPTIGELAFFCVRQKNINQTKSKLNTPLISYSDYQSCLESPYNLNKIWLMRCFMGFVSNYDYNQNDYCGVIPFATID